MDYIELFKWFHQHPEISFQEFNTTAKIKEVLSQYNVMLMDTPLKTGLVALIEGKHPGKTVGFRVDIDALPIQETSGLDYASLKDGVAHLCGHDFHITCGIAVAIALNENKDKLHGNVKIIFQAGEETSIGALDIMKHHLVDEVDYFVGLHADPTNPVGTLGISEGAVCAAVDRFILIVNGIGCHGAHPDDGKDPLVAALAIGNALPTIISRNLNAFRPSLLSLTRIEAGNTWNVVPTNAVLEGTFRTMDANDRQLVKQRIETLATSIANGYECTCDCEIVSGAGVVFNNPMIVEHAVKVANQCQLTVVAEEKSMGGDDFSYYSELKPSVYIKVGTGVGPTIHQSNFKVDPSALPGSIHYFVNLIQILLVN